MMICASAFDRHFKRPVDMAIAAGPAVDSRRRDIDNNVASLGRKIRLEMDTFERSFSSASSETFVDDRREPNTVCLSF